MTLEEASQLATIAGVILVVPQLVIAVYSIVRNNRREKIKSTLDYYEQINQQLKVEKKVIKEKYGEEINRELAIKIHDEKQDVSSINRILNLYERIALGINLGIYDIHALNRASGKLLVNNYMRFKPYIEYRRELMRSPNAWLEFENLYRKLNEIRQS